MARIRQLLMNPWRAVGFAALLICLESGASSQPYYFSHFAGSPDSPGGDDGFGTTALFHTPTAVACDLAGNLYVADGNQTIRKISPDGRVTTLAGLEGTTGSDDGSGSAARFNNPSGVALDPAGNVYVADTGNHTVRKITRSGLVTTLAGKARSPGNLDGVGSASRLNSPFGIAVDGAGNVYISEWSDTIRKITPQGAVTTIAGRPNQSGTADGPGASARFSLFPGGGLTADEAGNVFVADTVNCTIRKISNTGVVKTIAGAAGAPGYADGPAWSARFDSPFGVAMGPGGELFVLDTFNFVVRRLASGTVTTLAGIPGKPGSDDGGPGVGRLDEAWGIAFDGTDQVYVADTNNNTVRKMTSDGEMTTVAGRAGSSGSADGVGTAARFAFVAGVATDTAGNVYATDNRNHTVRKITPDGRVTTFAGLAGVGGSQDGAGAAARFGLLSGIAVDPGGNVFTVDWIFHTVRKITPQGVVSTFAGSPGSPGYRDGVATEARFDSPFGVAVDAAGNVYVADMNSRTIRKITPEGIVSTIAGSAYVLGSRDGPAGQALFYWPFGIAVDPAGTVYVADYGNSTIRAISPAGDVRTIAGAAGQMGGVDGPGSEARFSQPGGIAWDTTGIWVADIFNETVRRIAPDGFVTTEGGLAGSSGNRDGTGSEARFERPWGVAIDKSGNVYVADAGNNAVRLGRRVSTAGLVPDVATIDSEVGSVGEERRLDTLPRTATAWQWSVVRQPAGSAATLSSGTVPDPTFTPDVADLYVFRLVASGVAGSRTSYVSLRGQGRPSTLTRVVPVVVDVNNGSAHYTTELTLTNDTSSPTSVSMAYTPSLGSRQGGGTVTESLGPGEQRRIPDVLAYLRGRGLAIPQPSTEPVQGGTLRLVCTGEAVEASRVTALARTTAETRAPQPVGRAGTAYAAPLASEGASVQTVEILVSNENDRSNLAIANFSDSAVTYNVSVRDYSGRGGPAFAIRTGESLPPWGWVQINSPELLEAHGIGAGVATVTATSPGGSLWAYGVVNDRITNDGAFLLPQARTDEAAFVPAVETSSFVTELIIRSGDSSISPGAMRLTYSESLRPGLGAGGEVVLTPEPFEHRIVGALEALRQAGAAIGPHGGGDYGGTLEVQARGGAWVQARTLTPSPAGGRFGLFTPPVPLSRAAADRAAVYGLVSDGETRSNVALLHLGGEQDPPLTLQVQVMDGAAFGLPRGDPITVTLAPLEWRQLNGILRSAGVTEGWVEISRVSGSSPWYAYGVVNDGAFPGERTGDGAYVQPTR